MLTPALAVAFFAALLSEPTNLLASGGSTGNGETNASVDVDRTFKVTLSLADCEYLLLQSRFSANTRALVGTGTVAVRLMTGFGQTNIDIAGHDIRVCMRSQQFFFQVSCRHVFGSFFLPSFV